MSDTNITPNIKITATDDSGPTLNAFAQRVKDVSAAAQGAMSHGLTGEAKKFGDALKDAHKAADVHIGEGLTGSFGKASSAVAALTQGMTGLAVPLGLVGAAFAAGKSFMDFAAIQRGMEQIQFTTGATTRQMAELRGEMETLAQRSGRSTVELQENFSTFLSQSGLEFDQALKIFNSVETMSEVTGASLDGLGRIAGAAINNLKMSGEDLDKFLAGLATEMPAKMMESFATVFPRLSEQWQMMGFTGRQAGIELTAVFTQMGRALGNPRLAASSLTDLLSKMSDLSTPLGQRLLPVLEQIYKSGDQTGGGITALKSALDLLNQYKAFSDDPIMRGMAQQMFQISPEDLRGWKVLNDHMDAVMADIQKGLAPAQALADVMKDFDKDPLAAINHLLGSFQELETGFGELMVSFGADNALKAVADLFEDLASVIDGGKKNLYGMYEIISGHPMQGVKDIFAGVKTQGQALGNVILPDTIPTVQASRRDAAAAAAEKKSLPGSPGSVYAPPFVPAPPKKYARGGDVTAGEPIIVGEGGEELFVPEKHGSIVPGSRSSRGGGQDDDRAVKENTDAIKVDDETIRVNTDAIKGLTERLTFGIDKNGNRGLMRTAAFTPGAGELPTPAEAGVPIRGGGGGSGSGATGSWEGGSDGGSGGGGGGSGGGSGGSGGGAGGPGSGGGRTRPMGHRTAHDAAVTEESTAPLGEGKTTGGGSPYRAAQRAKMFEEYDKWTPEQKRTLAYVETHENAKDPAGVLESLANRTIGEKGQRTNPHGTLWEGLNSSGFYSTIGTARASARAGQGSVALADRTAAAIRGGRDDLEGRSDQGMLTDPGHRDMHAPGSSTPNALGVARRLKHINGEWYSDKQSISLAHIRQDREAQRKYDADEKTASASGPQVPGSYAEDANLAASGEDDAAIPTHAKPRGFIGHAADTAKQNAPSAVTGYGLNKSIQAGASFTLRKGLGIAAKGALGTVGSVASNFMGTGIFDSTPTGAEAGVEKTDEWKRAQAGGQKNLKELDAGESPPGSYADDAGLAQKWGHAELDEIEKRHDALRHRMSQPIKMQVDAPALPPHYESAWRRSLGRQQQKYQNDSISHQERVAGGGSALDYGLG